jgi:hypothetical protein
LKEELMARRRRSTLVLSGEQARQALAVLIHDGRVAASDAQKALERHRQLVTDLRSRLAELELDAGENTKRLFKDGPLPMARKAKMSKRPVVLKASRKKPRISQATRKKYQLQGRYIASLRNLPKESRAKVKAIREKSGVRAAIAAAKSWLAERRFITRQSKDSDQRRKKSGKRRSYPARPDPRPDKHGGSGAGRQQGGSGAGQERG